MEHRASTKSFQRARFLARLFNSPKDLPDSCISFSRERFHVSLGLPRLRLPCGFQLTACLHISSGDLRKVWSIHFHFLLLISMAIGSCLHLDHRAELEIVFGHQMLMILLKHRLTKTCSLFIRDSEVSHASQP